MPNPQQPELRRSERVPALSPDAAEAEVDARPDRPLSSERTDDQTHEAPTPEHDTPEQDKPDLDDMAEALGIRDDS